MKIRLLINILVLFVLACSQNHTTQNNPNIVFLSNRDAPKGKFDIFLLNMENDSLQNLSINIKGITSISHPILSPDGQKVLFVGFEKNKSLQLLDIQNKSVMTLAELKTDTPKASFSADGKFIVFVNKVNNKRQIIRIHTDGTNEKALSDFQAEDFDPCISYDGLKIAFIRKIGKEHSLCIMDMNGKNFTTIAQLSGPCGHPSFSPDGKNIVFHAFNKGSNNIYNVNLKSRQVELIYQNNVRNVDPIFSPDGQYVAFLSNIRGMKYQDIITLDIKTQSVKVASNKINIINQNPGFSPDGKKIVFESVMFNNSEIYVVNVNGKNLKNLSSHESWDCSPSF